MANKKIKKMKMKFKTEKLFLFQTIKDLVNIII
jgi:hypothetical protein